MKILEEGELFLGRVPFDGLFEKKKTIFIREFRGLRTKSLGKIVKIYSAKIPRRIKQKQKMFARTRRAFRPFDIFKPKNLLV